LRGALAAADDDAGRALVSEQSRALGVAWDSTCVLALQQMLGWAQRLQKVARCRELENLLLRAAFS
jgi:hypothetical protein